MQLREFTSHRHYVYVLYSQEYVVFYVVSHVPYPDANFTRKKHNDGLRNKEGNNWHLSYYMYSKFRTHPADIPV